MPRAVWPKHSVLGFARARLFFHVSGRPKKHPARLMFVRCRPHRSSFSPLSFAPTNRPPAAAAVARHRRESPAHRRRGRRPAMAWHNASASTRSNLAAATSIVRQLDLRRIRRREAEHREVWAKPTPPCAGERSSAGHHYTEYDYYYFEILELNT